MSSLKDNYSRVTGTQKQPFVRLGTTNGLLGGNSSANVNGSITPIDFYITPESNETMEIVEFTMEISDSGSPGLEDYGNVVGPLTNGVQIFVEKSNVRSLLGLPLKSNRSVINLGPSVNAVAFSGNERIVTSTFNMKDFAKGGITINGRNGDKIGITINDDLSTLIEHSIVMKGSIGFLDV